MPQHVDKVNMLQADEKACKTKKAVLQMRALTQTLVSWMVGKQNVAPGDKQYHFNKPGVKQKERTAH